MSELRDRLEALAARGTRRGADDVLDAARQDAETSADTSGANGAGAPGTDDMLPIVTLEPGTRRRRFGSFVAAVGIAALVGVGALAVTAMFGSGGAGSPEGAVRQLADAIAHKDPLAAVDVLVPSEVRSLRDTVHTATQRAAELKLVDQASQPLAGVDLSVDHLELTTTPLADGFAKVTVTSGEISASTHRAQMSALLQKALRGSGADAQGQVDVSKLAANADLPTFVVAVRHDGRWYVSPEYTALEYAREANDGPAASFGSAQAAALGASTPESAVTDALHAWQAANWDRLMALAPPDELPVYDYRTWIDQELADTHPDFTIDKLSTSVTVNGDTAVVKLDASGTMGSDPVERWQAGGHCTGTGSGSVSEKFVSGNGTSSGSLGTPSSQGDMRLCLAGDLGQVVPFGLRTGGASDSANGSISIEVVREDGRWFVSPVSTVLDAVDAAIQHIDQRTLYSLLGLAYELPPDGNITLDQPFDVPASTSEFSSRVYAFDGQAGQELVGQIDSPGGKDLNSAYGSLYTADGKQVGAVDFQTLPAGGQLLGFVSTTKLPYTASYRLVLDPYVTSGNGATLTVWEVAHAPKQLRDSVGPHSYTGGGQSCTYSPGVLGGTESCTAVAVPTTAFVAPGSTSQSSSGSTSETVPSASATSSPATATTSP